MDFQKNSLKLTCFKTYDIRGKIGSEINEKVVFRIARGIASSLRTESIVVGFDARETSPLFAQIISKALTESGLDVLDIGLAGTEEMYWAVTNFETGGGLMVTASHNPIDYNGIKIVKARSRPLTESDFSSIKVAAEKGDFVQADRPGEKFEVKELARGAYVKKLKEFLDLPSLKPLKIVRYSGNGAALYS